MRQTPLRSLLRALLSARLTLPALLTVGAVTVGGAAGCTSLDQMQEKLYDATRAYNRSLRWADWDRAAEHLPPESADGFLDSHETVDERLVVIDYELTRLKLDKPTGRAACRVEIQWHTDDRLIVEHTTVDQWWQYYEGGWYLVDERRVAGKPLAIFAELGGDEDHAENVEDERVASGPLDHPYLPGLERFRDSRDIGLSEDEKRKRDRARRKAARKAKKAGVPPTMMDMNAPDTAEGSEWSAEPSGSNLSAAPALREW